MLRPGLSSRFIILGIFLLVSLKSLGQHKESRLLAFIELAEQNYNKKNYREALVNLDSALALDPDYGKIYLIRAGIYLSQNQQRRALNEYSNAIRFDPANPVAYYKRSLIRHEIGDHRNYSLNDINKAIELDPENAQYYLEKALYLTSSTYPLPEYNLAIESVTEAIRIQPENAEFYNIRAKYESESGQRLTSLTDFSKAIELNPSKATYHHDRGLIYLMIEDYETAIDDFNSAIQLDPLNEKFLTNRGQARFNLNDYETAILDFTLSIDTIYKKISEEPGQITRDHSLNKSLRRTYLYRGSALLQQEHVFEACEDFEAASNLGDTQASRYIGSYCR